jgi:hypothetical protein
MACAQSKRRFCSTNGGDNIHTQVPIKRQSAFRTSRSGPSQDGNRVIDCACGMPLIGVCATDALSDWDTVRWDNINTKIAVSFTDYTPAT